MASRSSPPPLPLGLYRTYLPFEHLQVPAPSSERHAPSALNTTSTPRTQFHVPTIIVQGVLFAEIWPAFAEAFSECGTFSGGGPPDMDWSDLPSVPPVLP